MKPNTNNNVSSNTKKKSKLKEANPKDKDKELENKRLIRCKICLNPSTKTTLNFSCNHNLCGICVAHFLIQCDFSCLSEKKTIKIDCPICKIGSIDTSLEEINKVLDETHQTRTQKKKDICATHKKLAEDYCIECKKWLCGECKKIFHDSYFKDHNLVPEVPFEFKKCKNHDDNKKDLFCTSCSEEICHFCNRKGESHEGHPIMTLMEYKDHVLDCKKEYKYQKFEVFDNFLTELEVEFTEKFNNSFNKKKELIDEITKLVQKPRNMEYYYSREGNIMLDENILKREKKKELLDIKINISKNNKIFGELNVALKSLEKEMKQVCDRMTEISNLFKKLYDMSINNSEKLGICKYYSDLSLFFKEYGNNEFQQMKNISEELKFHLKYLNLHYTVSIDELYNTFKFQHDLYFQVAENLKQKKETLYKNMDIEKWDLNPEDRNIDYNDKNLVMKKMLPNDTQVVNEIKKYLIYYATQLNNENLRIKDILENKNNNNFKKLKDKSKQILNEFSGFLELMNSKNEIN